MNQSRKTTCFVVLMFVLACSIRWQLSVGKAASIIEVTPDSQGYQLLAVNLFAGNGYRQCPRIGYSYDPFTASLLAGTTPCEDDRPGCGRSPGYPLFLAALYAVHGIDTKWVCHYQKLMATLVAGLLPLAGFLICRHSGAIAGVIAAAALAVNPDAGYATTALLTECLTEFLATAGLVLALWAQGRRPIAFVPSSVMLGMATLVRPGMACVATCVGLWWLIRDWRSGITFVATLAIVVGSWSVWATCNSGRLVLLSGNSGPVVIAGIDPVRAAAAAKIAEPKLTEESLTHFWVCWPGASDGSVVDYLRNSLKNPMQFLKVQTIKLRIALRSLPDHQVGLICFGAALGAALKTTRTLATRPVVNACPAPLPAWWALACLAQTCLAATVINSAFLQFIALLIAAVVAFAIGIGVRKSNRLGTTFGSGELICFLVGYFLMIMMSIGNPRFVRPLLPTFHLAACLTVPLAASSIVALVHCGRPRNTE
ncbi:MAG: hypothetical protein JSS49_30830 [Planctomycetes bacterium]|nr:hypothetical protein [Planctomycetota bacterium]